VTGAIYEIGALAALEDRIEGVNITDFDMFVGVSAGSYIGALLANSVTPGSSTATSRGAKSGGARRPRALPAQHREIRRRVAARPARSSGFLGLLQNRRETTLTDLVSRSAACSHGPLPDDGLRGG
jgi:hypothetical protein